jgi:C4-type Zn-finger protein
LRKLRNLKLTVRNINNIRDLYRGIGEFKKGYKSRTIIVKDEKGNSITDSHIITTRWRNYFSQLLNVHGVNDVRQQKYTQQNHYCLSQVPWSLS